MPRLLLIMFLLATGMLPSLASLPLDSLLARAGRGEPESMYRLSWLLEEGRVLPADSLRADSLLRASARGGYAQACNMLGYRYMSVRPDSALYWIEKAAMATPPDPRAFNNLGYMLSTGAGGVKKDLQRARYWYAKGAQAGVPTAQTSLALMLLADTASPDTTQARLLLTQAARAGFVPAAQELYLLLSPGFKALTPDQALTQAREYYGQGIFAVSAPLLMLATEATDPLGLALLAQSYATGRGVDYDYDHAMHLFWHAALRSDPSAAYIVGEAMEQFPDAFSSEATPDPQQRTAAEWLQQAAQAGVTDAREALRRLEPQAPSSPK